MVDSADYHGALLWLHMFTSLGWEKKEKKNAQLKPDEQIYTFAGAGALL